MITVNDSDDQLNLSGSAVTIGTFDGLHVGHYEIIKKLKKTSKELGLSSVLITFYPHPRKVLTNDFNLRLLTPIEEKKKLIEGFGIDYLYIINFSEEFSKTTYDQFVDEILVGKINAKHLVIGYDHKFGNNRAGDIKNLISYTKKKNIGMSVVGPEKVDNKIVSSTKIRKALLEGNVEFANKMLGRNYFLDGIVVPGAKRGRELGYPTANLGLKENDKLVPKNGVYFVKAFVEGTTYFGVANIGLRPTFNNVTEPITEVFIFEFDKDIYNKQITVEFIRRIRDEKKFSSREELEKNIKLDVEKAKRYISEIN